MTITQSALALGEAFNDCPGGDWLSQQLFDHHLTDHVYFADLDRPYWRNSESTLVVATRVGLADDNFALARTVLGLGQIAVDSSADEFHWELVGDQFVVRLWWD